MKYVIEWSIRSSGLTHQENLAGRAALLTAFSKWKPEDGLKVNAFLSDVSSDGGYVFVEADDPKIVLSFVAKFQFWNEIKVVPVLDVMEAVPIAHASIEWAGAAIA